MSHNLRALANQAGGIMMVLGIILAVLTSVLHRYGFLRINERVANQAKLSPLEYLLLWIVGLMAGSMVLQGLAAML